MGSNPTLSATNTRRRPAWLLASSVLLGGVACSSEPADREAAAPATTTTIVAWDPPVPGTTVSVERPLPAAAAPAASWTEPIALDGSAATTVPLAGGWLVLDPEREELRTAHRDRAGGWSWRSFELPAGVADSIVGRPLDAGGWIVPLASGGVLVGDVLGDPEVVDTGAVGAGWVYGDGISLFSDDGRALDRAWNNEMTVRRVETFRTPSDDRFLVRADGELVVVDLFGIDRRVRIDVGAPVEVTFDADLSGTVHVVARAGARAGYLSITQAGEVSAIEAVPVDARVRVVPNTTTVSLSDGRRVWTRVAPDPVGIVSADLPEETCQWVRDYAEEIGGATAPTMRLEQGVVPGFPTGYGGGWLSMADGVFRPDLDGDGARDAVFVVWCSTGGSGHNAEVHTIDASGRSLGWFEVGEDAAERRLWSLTVDGSDVVVEYPSADTRVTDRYRWADGTLHRIDRRTWSAADAAQDVLDAINRGGDGLLVADPDAFVALSGLRDEHGDLRGCASTAADGADRTCVISAADEPGVDYELRLTWIDVDEWRATALTPARS